MSPVIKVQRKPDGLHFLVVDDNPTITRLIELQMVKAGYRCDTAASGDEALELIRRRDYDLVMSDISMPGLNGLELLKAIKRTKPLVPVLIITGHATIENAVAALRLGAINFITKPIRFDEVFETIDKVLSINNREHTLRATNRYLVRETRHFTIPTGDVQASDLAACLAEPLNQTDLVDSSCVKSVTMALYEAITNAVEHGNLGLDSALKFSGPKGIAAFRALKQQRLQDPSFAGRPVTIESVFDSCAARYTITDQGAGFDYAALADPTSEESLDAPHGRGIFLIRQMFDGVSFNERGNSITLELHRKPRSAPGGSC